MSSAQEREVFERALAAEVRAELAEAQAGRAEQELGEPITDWRFDPAEAQEYEARLHSLLGAVETMEQGNHDQLGG